jgi:hypothetical protein
MHLLFYGLEASLSLISLRNIPEFSLIKGNLFIIFNYFVVKCISFWRVHIEGLLRNIIYIIMLHLKIKNFYVRLVLLLIMLYLLLESAQHLLIHFILVIRLFNSFCHVLVHGNLVLLKKMIYLLKRKFILKVCVTSLLSKHLTVRRFDVNTFVRIIESSPF